MKLRRSILTCILLLVTSNLIAAGITIDMTNVYVSAQDASVKENCVLMDQNAYVGANISYSALNPSVAKKIQCKWKLYAEIPGKKPKKLLAGKFMEKNVSPNTFLALSTDVTEKLFKKLGSKKIAAAFQDGILACTLEAEVKVSVKGQKMLRIFLDPKDVTVYQTTRLYEMVLIPAGSNDMGNCMDPVEGNPAELPVHSVFISAFYMDKYEVSKSKWDDVYTWAIANGYSFDNAGSGKASNHPVQTITWYDCVKWCNARSEKEEKTPCYYTDATKTTVYKTGQLAVANDWVNWDANGYRLPTEAEWEKAARGGAAGHRFPWSDTNTITHSRANYDSNSSYSYDVSPTSGYHPDYNDGTYPYTSPVGSFAANGYGLYDMAGNIHEWCWDWYGSRYYSSSPASNPRGPATSTSRVLRGGSWSSGAFSTRCAGRHGGTPGLSSDYRGFRCVGP